MQVPVVVSRTSPTWLSRQLAEQWNITAIGYARGSEMNVYTHPWRILPATSSAITVHPSVSAVILDAPKVSHSD